MGGGVVFLLVLVIIAAILVLAPGTGLLTVLRNRRLDASSDREPGTSDRRTRSEHPGPAN